MTEVLEQVYIDASFRRNRIYPLKCCSVLPSSLYKFKILITDGRILNQLKLANRKTKLFDPNTPSKK